MIHFYFLVAADNVYLIDLRIQTKLFLTVKCA